MTIPEYPCFFFSCICVCWCSEFLLCNYTVFLFEFVYEQLRCFPCALQVKEKLSALEYKEFVNLMKALKSKAMKISEVLQSIARLFSGPERLPLLKR